MPDICVVHLVRAVNGIEPLDRFLKSYDRHAAGSDHDLVFIFKGFSKGHLPMSYELLLQPYSYRALFVLDFGFDVRPYMIAAKAFHRDYKYFCFLNSFSEILADNWLLKLYQNILIEDVGLVGATGSYQSIYSDILNDLRQGIIDSRYKQIAAGIAAKIFRFLFYPFPNYHIRSNAFMVSDEIISKIHYRLLIIKLDAWLFESGKKGLSSQVLNMNKRLLVVSKDGKGYEKEDWQHSNTFWQGNQSNLLIADNQTNKYSQGDVYIKKFLSRHAWGNEPVL